MRLADLTPFDWEEMHVVSVLESVDDIEQQRGIIWPSHLARGTTDPESGYNILFIDHGEVVYWFTDDYSWVWLFNERFDRGFAKDECEFRIVRDDSGNCGWLELLRGSDGVVD